MSEQTELLLKYRVDQASVQVALAADKQIQDQLNKTAKAGVNLADVNEKLNKSLATGLRSAAVDNLSDEFQQVLKETGSVEDALIRVQQRLRDIGATDAEIERVGRSIASIRENADGAGTAPRNGVGRALNRAGTQLFMLPDVGPSTDISRGMIIAGRAADRLNLSAGALAAGLGVAGLATVAFSLVLDQAAKSAETAKQRLSAALVAQNAYYDAVNTLTTEQASARIAEIQREREVVQQRLNELEGAISGAGLTKTTLFGVDIGIETQTFKGALGDLFGITDDLFQQRDEARTQLQALTDEETRLTQGRAQGVFAANDIAAAEERLAQARIKRLQEEFSGAEQQALQDLELSRLLREGISGTDESAVRAVEQQIDERIAAAREEAFAYEQLKDQADQRVQDLQASIAAAQFTDLNPAALELLNAELQIAQDQSDRYAAKLNDLNRIIAILLPGLGLVRENLQALTNATAVSQQTDNYFEALKQEGEIRADIAETMAKIAEFEAEANEKLQDLAAQRAEKYLELEETKAERLETIAENSADRIAKIQRDLARDYETAVGERDALAAHQAKQRAADALEDQQEADNRALKQLEKTLDKQERNIDRSYERQQQNIINSLAKQVQTQRQGLRQLEVDLQNNQRAQLLIAANGSGGVRIIHEQMWQNVYNTTVSWAVNTVNVVRAILAPLPTPQNRQTGSNRYVTQRQARDIVFRELDRVITPIARGGR